MKSAEIQKEQEGLLCFSHEKGEMSNVAKLWRLLSKLSPLYTLMHPLQKQGKVLRMAVAAVLCFTLGSLPVYASTDSTLPTDLTATATPTTTLQQSTTSTTDTATTTSITNGDAFITAGPLTAATTESVQTLSVTQGNSYYVSTTGSDTGDGSSGQAWKSLSYAVSKLKAGDTLTIKEGTYNMSAGAVFTTSGTADAHITIKGEGNVVIDGTSLYAYTAVFNTGGQSYLDFDNLNVNNSRAAVQVVSNSSNITIDGLKTDHNQMAVIIDQGSYITVKNGVFANSRNAVVANNTSNHMTFENIEAYGSQDIYAGYETLYRNGDGFIMNLGTSDVVFRNIVSHDNWDAGIDCKANNVLIDGVIVYSNKNNFKMWGNNITIQNSMSFGARILADDPVSGEGNGLNARTGSITILNSTFFDNGNNDIQVDNQGGASNVTVENSIFYRNISSGNMIALVGGNFTEKNNLFFWEGHTNPGFTLNSTSKWADPQFVNSKVSDLPLLTNTAVKTRDLELVKPLIDLHLQSTSPAINLGNLSFPVSSTDLDGNVRVSGSSVDLGAYEFSGSLIQPGLVGVQNGATVSGTVAIGPNLQLHPDTQRVVYTLNGISSGDVMQSPFFWGGAAGNGTAGFDTKTLANGAYTLKAVTYGNSGSYQMSVNFTVNNPIVSPGGDFSGVTDGSVLSGTVNVGPNMSAHPDVRKAAYYLNGSQSGKVYAQPFYWGGVSGTGETGFDTKTLVNGNYTLGMIYTDAVGDHSVTVSFAVNNSADTTAPALSAIASTGVTSTGVTINWTSNEASDSQIQYRAQGSSAWLNSTLNTSMVTNHSVTLAGLNAGTVYEYQVKSKDQAGNLAIAAAVSNFTTLPPPDTTAPVLSAVIASGITTSGAVVNWTTNEASDSQVEYRVQGSTVWTATSVNAAMVLNHSVTLSGLNANTTYEFRVKSKDQSGNLATQGTIATVKTLAVISTTCTTAMCGVTEGQTVSGTIKVQPNLTLNPDIKKVSYYLNGKGIGKEYAAPFTMGGADGFDTKTLADGTYTISGAYTTSTGDKAFSFTFTVKNNTGTVSTQSVCSTALCGVSNGQILQGTVAIQPNLTLIPGVKKVSYYVDGKLVTREYNSPFLWNFDTSKYANGTHTISGAYTTAAGDVPFTFTVTIKN